ncbi:Histone-lysine N-methyltransferase SETMAR [Eumeta japonica]|uniref:Histone-lysine N-methyltransferase SETMAR n=1 Tax=Eumeta variegata TaxID=151549 RepID=A0A4C1XY68_EUMVA|nr:Histone-lysine N-methyltransferase SETMAR [Eumeta japonica]
MSEQHCLLWKFDAAKSFVYMLWSVCDIDATKEAIETQSSTSTRPLSDSLRLSKDTIHRHLKSLGKTKTYKNCRIVPHELNEFQAKRRIEVCKQLVAPPKDDRFIKRIITCDEKWIYPNNLNMDNQRQRTIARIYREKLLRAESLVICLVE